MKYTFHPHFCSKFESPSPFWGQITDLVACWLFSAWFGYFGYFRSELNGTSKIGTKVGVKSIFHLMTFFDLRPNNGVIDLFAFAAIVHCNSLRARETPNFLFCFGNGTPIPTQIRWKIPRDIFLKLSLGVICPPGSCVNENPNTK